MTFKKPPRDERINVGSGWIRDFLGMFLSRDLCQAAGFC